MLIFFTEFSISIIECLAFSFVQTHRRLNKLYDVSGAAAVKSFPCEAKALFKTIAIGYHEAKYIDTEIKSLFVVVVVVVIVVVVVTNSVRFLLPYIHNLCANCNNHCVRQKKKHPLAETNTHLASMAIFSLSCCCRFWVNIPILLSFCFKAMLSD